MLPIRCALGLLALLAISTQSLASGSYTCCFLEDGGKQQTVRSRASTYYKGSIDRLCKVWALTDGRRLCRGDLTKPTEGFDADLDLRDKPVPARHNLTGWCRTADLCIVGIIATAEQQVDVTAKGSAKCSVENDIASEDGVNSYKVTATIPSGPGDACTLTLTAKSGGEKRSLDLVRMPKNR